MIYLFALAGVKGLENLIFDGILLVADVIAVLQMVKMENQKSPPGRGGRGG